MLYLYPDIVKVGYETIRRFYTTELNLSYKRCRKPIPPVALNFNALAGMLEFIKKHLEGGYHLFSLDEAGFGS